MTRLIAVQKHYVFILQLAIHAVKRNWIRWLGRYLMGLGGGPGPEWWGDRGEVNQWEAGIWSWDLSVNDRPGSDHVTWGPMRGLKKITWKGDIRQTDQLGPEGAKGELLFSSVELVSFGVGRWLCSLSKMHYTLTLVLLYIWIGVRQL